MMPAIVGLQPPAGGFFSARHRYNVSAMSNSAAHIRILFPAPLNLGPGKMRLLGAIREAGSISGAARKLHISYRRAWLMADALNKAFPQPLIDTMAGGAKGGGTRLTALGEEVAERYRDLVGKAEGAIAEDVVWFLEQAGRSKLILDG